MSDRELLELAAKAAGINPDTSPYNGGGAVNDGFDSAGNIVVDWHNYKRWNPLTDDGDALRLAVKLNMHVLAEFDCGKGSTADVLYFTGPEFDYHVISELLVDSPYAATRRAIVRAAAEIGKGME